LASKRCEFFSQFFLHLLQLRRRSMIASIGCIGCLCNDWEYNLGYKTMLKTLTSSN
ncbi:hypothetical protein ACH5RR_013448, partial [Cinchona calisaya]